jgi:hypothetical protein
VDFITPEGMRRHRRDSAERGAKLLKHDSGKEGQDQISSDRKAEAFSVPNANAQPRTVCLLKQRGL